MPCVNADKTKVVPCDSADAAFNLSAADTKALGLDPGPDKKAMAPAEDKAAPGPADKK